MDIPSLIAFASVQIKLLPRGANGTKMGTVASSRVENEWSSSIPRKEAVNIPLKASCENIIPSANTTSIRGTHRAGASLPPWVTALTAGSCWQRWKEALYGFLYFLLHLDGLIDL